MRAWRGRLILPLAAVALSSVPWRVDAAGAPHRVVVRHLRLHRGLGFRRPLPVPQPPVLTYPRPDELFPPPIEVPEPSEEPSGPLLFPHGFVLTVPVRSGARPQAPAAISRFVQVGTALVACWVPPATTTWSSITLRVSFKRNGSVNGVPRVPFVDAAGAEQKSGLAQSLLSALKTCTPLPFSSSLGAAIAGEIFAIRFVNQDRK